jgi:hypothetical protein
LALASFVGEEDGFLPSCEQDIQKVVRSHIARVDGTHFFNLFDLGGALDSQGGDGGGVLVVPWHGFTPFSAVFDSLVGVFDFPRLRRSGHPMFHPRNDIITVQPRIDQNVYSQKHPTVAAFPCWGAFWNV